MPRQARVFSGWRRNPIRAQLEPAFPSLGRLHMQSELRVLPNASPPVPLGWMGGWIRPIPWARAHGTQRESGLARSSEARLGGARVARQRVLHLPQAGGPRARPIGRRCA